MINRYEYLSNSSFLKKIDRLINKQQLIKIIALDSNEEALQEIQGQIINGSLNLDGKSSVRRTGSLTFLPQDQNKTMEEVKMLISKNKKIKIEIGIKNTTDEYLEHSFIWFPLGLFIITDVSFSYGTQGVNISLQLKDKMCLLNGDCGGVIPAAVNFSKYDTIDENNEIITLDVPIYNIIYELVNHFGGEELNKIIIRDIDSSSKRVVKWVGDTPLYIYKADNSYQYLATTNKNEVLNKVYKTYNKGEDIGYEQVEFTYPGKEGLTANAGETVCQVLDKIKNTLGNFEYFYDINGNFVFQEIKNYLNTSRATVELNALNNEDYLISPNRTTEPYSFDDEVLISSYSNSPQINLIKNDFVVWGKRKGAEDKEYEIRYHLALDQKPETGKRYRVVYYKNEDGIKVAKPLLEFDNRDAFPKEGEEGVFYYDRQTEKVYKWYNSWTRWTPGSYRLIHCHYEITTVSDWRSELYLQGAISAPLGTTSNYYYPELYNEWPKLYDVEKGKYIAKNGTDIDYYLDFIDSSAPEVAEISVFNIGRRTEVINDDKVNCIFEPDIPNMWIVLDDEYLLEKENEAKRKGEDYLLLANEYTLNTSTGGGYNSAYQVIRQRLHTYLNYSQTISVSSIPIYHLEPNTVISISNEESGVCGEYVINTISIPFDVSSVMNISCSKVIERI